LVFAIMGAPNVGKSSLMNALARRDIAIVSALPGTTRDALETRIDLGGIPVTLIDTAGLRETTDPIEAEGVRRARARAASADLVLHLVDARDPDGEAIAGELRIANKIDLAVAPAGLPGISVRSGQGMDQLETLLAARAASLAYAGAEPVLTRARHAAALRQAATALHAGLQNLAPELRAEELRQVSRAFGRITGAVDAEGVLDLVFGAFCIGK
jgi:tRNA modification GTPase